MKKTIALWFATMILNQIAPAQTYKVAFGSCNNQELPQEMWKEIVEQQPDLWIWMGGYYLHGF
jgi:alkaline phosphatase D